MVISEIIIISAFSGFIAGVLAAIAFMIYIFIFTDYSRNEPDWERCLDPRTDKEIQEEHFLNERLMNKELDKETWASKKNYSEKYIEGELLKAKSELEKQKTYVPCPRPYAEYNKGAAIILTLIKDKNWPVEDFDDQYHTICVMIEEITENGKKIIIENREYGGWPISWSRDAACAIGNEKGLPVFGQDLMCDLSK